MKSKSNKRSPWQAVKKALLWCHHRWLYFVMRTAALPFRVKTLNTDGSKFRSRIKGGALLIGNHTGLTDPILISGTFRGRWIHYLVAENVMTPGIATSLLRMVGCIRVDRTICDLTSMKQSINALKNGDLLVVFPEGGIRHGDSVSTFKSGMVLMAVRANVPIIPVYITTKEESKRRYAIVGRAFHVKDYCSGKFPSMAEISRMTEEVHAYELTLQSTLHEILNGGKNHA